MKHNIQTKPAQTRFHYIITKYLLSSFGYQGAKTSLQKQQKTTELKQSVTNILAKMLHLVKERVSHALIFLLTTVRLAIRKYKQAKKQMAPTSWSSPVPPVSMVAMAAMQPSTANIVGQYMYAQVPPGYSQFLACLSYHRKMVWKMRVRKPEAVSIPHLKICACGQWHAVFVMVV